VEKDREVEFVSVRVWKKKSTLSRVGRVFVTRLGRETSVPFRIFFSSFFFHKRDSWQVCLELGQ